MLSVTVYSFASAYALEGIPDSESALFLVMAKVVGLDVQGISVASPALLLLARVAGVAVIASFVAIALVRKRLAGSRPPA